MKIYTRMGDSGETSLFSGQRLAKSDPIFDALGAIDEGNSALGCALSLLPDWNNSILERLKGQLLHVQHALFDLGASLATPRNTSERRKLEKTRFDDSAVALLEQWIDAWENTLPRLHNFILPGGHPAGAALHLSRSVLRRAERAAVPLHREGSVEHSVLVYLNRLSDYLFMAARMVNHTLNISETPWAPSTPPPSP